MAGCLSWHEIRENPVNKAAIYGVKIVCMKVIRKALRDTDRTELLSGRELYTSVFFLSLCWLFLVWFSKGVHVCMHAEL